MNLIHIQHTKPWRHWAKPKKPVANDHTAGASRFRNSIQTGSDDMLSGLRETGKCLGVYGLLFRVLNVFLNLDWGDTTLNILNTNALYTLVFTKLFINLIQEKDIGKTELLLIFLQCHDTFPHIMMQDHWVPFQLEVTLQGLLVFERWKKPALCN